MSYIAYTDNIGSRMNCRYDLQGFCDPFFFMAKDPAVLFYTSDFLSGTFTLTDEQVGKYIRLLCLQHQKGKLTEKDMLSICKAYDVDIYEKFKIEDGFYLNEKMYNETIRRQKFTESRRNNAKTPKNDSISEAHAKHMHKHMETETETENETINITKTAKKPKIKIEVTLPWSSQKFADNWENWKLYRSKEHKFKYKSEHSEQAALNDLVKISGGIEDIACQIIQQSMAKSWRGLFELKTTDNGNTKTNQTRGSKITSEQLQQSLTKQFSQR